MMDFCPNLDQVGETHAPKENYNRGSSWIIIYQHLHRGAKWFLKGAFFTLP